MSEPLGLRGGAKTGKKSVCIFLDDRDVKMVVGDDGGPAYELDRCGVALDLRMTFYDHVHTTGIDIKQALSAVAVVTLGKDMTLRDYSQGCWRMRALGKGQCIHLLFTPEIRGLISSVKVTQTDTQHTVTVSLALALQHLTCSTTNTCALSRSSAYLNASLLSLRHEQCSSSV